MEESANGEFGKFLRQDASPAIMSGLTYLVGSITTIILTLGTSTWLTATTSCSEATNSLVSLLRNRIRAAAAESLRVKYCCRVSERRIGRATQVPLVYSAEFSHELQRPYEAVLLATCTLFARA